MRLSARRWLKLIAAGLSWSRSDYGTRFNCCAKTVPAMSAGHCQRNDQPSLAGIPSNLTGRYLLLTLENIVAILAAPSSVNTT